MIRVWVPRDAAARALGADAVAAAVQGWAQATGQAVALTRNGSRGMVWLEPLVEVERGGVRHAYGPATAADVPAILDGTSPLHL
ncbi:MAG: formate dehydrogenase, partial [Gemmobacter sp.]